MSRAKTSVEGNKRVLAHILEADKKNRGENKVKGKKNSVEGRQKSVEGDQPKNKCRWKKNVESEDKVSRGTKECRGNKKKECRGGQKCVEAEKKSI